MSAITWVPFLSALTVITPVSTLSRNDFSAEPASGKAHPAQSISTKFPSRLTVRIFPTGLGLPRAASGKTGFGKRTGVARGVFSAQGSSQETIAPVVAATSKTVVSHRIMTVTLADPGLKESRCSPARAHPAPFCRAEPPDLRTTEY